MPSSARTRTQANQATSQNEDAQPKLTETPPENLVPVKIRSRRVSVKAPAGAKASTSNEELGNASKNDDDLDWPPPSNQRSDLVKSKMSTKRVSQSKKTTGTSEVRNIVELIRFYWRFF